MYYILLCMIINLICYVTCVEEAKTLLNKDFVADIVGMSEEKFREFLSSKAGKKVDDWKSDWIKQFPRRAAIFYEPPVTASATVKTSTGDIQIGRGVSIAEYENAIASNSTPLSDKPIFSIQFFDKSKWADSDIRWLQANPELKGAVFQIASNFNTLEGGMGDPHALLTNMLAFPVQGELASISAAGGTIQRKYFFNSINLLYLLHKDNGIEMNVSDGFANPTDKTIKSIIDGTIKVDAINYKKIAVCLHTVVVTSGSGGTGENDEVKRLAVALNSDGTVDVNKTQIVHQVFTAALDLRDFKPLHDNLGNFAKLIIKASYEGTVKAVFVLREPRVILTLMGGGSFRNDILWIAEALEGLEGFIKEKGMQILLMYRPDVPDKPRLDPVRTADGDIAFLKKMVALANRINGTNYNFDTVIQDYVAKAYAKQKYDNEVQQLQKYFPLTNFYTPTPSKAPTIPPTITDISPEITTSLNKLTQALRAVDSMLISTKKDEYQVGSKTIKLVVGDIAAQERIEVLVNAANTGITGIGGGGVAGAIGAKMTEEDKKLFAEDIENYYKTKIGKPGFAYIGRLAAGSALNKLGYKWAMSAVGPNCSAGEDPNLVGPTYNSALQEAARVGAKSIIIPRISAAIFKCDPNIIDPLAVNAVVDYLSKNQDSSLQTVYLIFYPEKSKEPYAVGVYRKLLDAKVTKK